MYSYTVINVQLAWRHISKVMPKGHENTLLLVRKIIDASTFPCNRVGITRWGRHCSPFFSVNTITGDLVLGILNTRQIM